jgi:hypothetical protein
MCREGVSRLGHVSEGQTIEFASCATLSSMPAFHSADRAANRTAMAREARRIAEEIEGLYIQLEQIGALATIRHQEGVPRFDMLQASKALRCYAGVLSLIAGATPRPRGDATSASESSPTD